MKEFARIGMTLLLAGIMILSSCRKDDDTDRPVITIIEPGANEVFAVTDTIHILARVSHEKDISEVSIVIRDQAGNAVTVPRFFFPGTREYTLETGYVVNAPGLPSGTYSLTIAAGDGELNVKEYLPLYLEGVEREFQRALALCRPSALKTYIYSINADWEAQSIKTLDYGFSRAEISSSQRKLKLIKPQPSALFVYDLDELAEDEWLTASTPFPVFNDLMDDGQLTYLATGNGDIKGLNQYAQVQYVTPLMDTVPELLHRHANIVLAFSRNRGGPDRYIMQYYTGTGSLKAFSKVGFNIVSMFSADEAFCLLFAVEGDVCRIHTYHVEGNYLSESILMPAGEIRDVARIGPGEYLVAHSDGLFLYSNVTGSLVLWSAGSDFQHLAYDEVRSLLYCSTDFEVRVFRADNAIMVKEFTLPYPVYDIHIQYNI